MTPAQLLRETRKRHGVSQKDLARRAGTTQPAISRIERGGVSPTFETLSELLYLLGEDLVLGAEPTDSGIDRSLIRERLKLTPTERLDYAIAMADQIIESSPNVRKEDWANGG